MSAQFSNEAPHVSKHRYLLGLLPILFGLGGVVWIFWPNLETANAELVGNSIEHSVVSTASEEAPVRVDATKVHRTSIPLLARATGHLRPWREVTLAFNASGRVAWQDITEGDRVEAGQLLARLETQDLVLDKSEAEANLLKARADFAITFVNSERLDQGSGGDAPRQLEAEEALRSHRKAETLFRDGLISKEEFERSQRRLDAAQMLTGEQREEVQAAVSGLTQAELAFKWTELALDRASLLAPFSGRVADLDIEVGQQLSSGHACLVLMDDSRVKVDVEVLESDMIHLRRGTPATVRLPSLGETAFSGEVFSVNPRIDPESGTGRVTVMIKNPEGTLLPGLFATVDLEVQILEDRLVLPVDAVLERQGKNLVFRLEDGRARWTYVSLGARSRGMVEIIEGLEEGQQVAVDGHFALAHESPVEIRSAETAAPHPNTRPVAPSEIGAR